MNRLYNRYIPRPDGSYSRCRIPEPHPPRQNRRPAPPPPPPPPQEPQYCPKDHTNASREANPFGFLRQLLGKDFDTGDILVILLLLLMAGDSEEERNNALLTIALYFMM